MYFNLNLSTEIQSCLSSKPVENAISILKRDMSTVLQSSTLDNKIVLKSDGSLKSESYIIDVDSDITIRASDELGFVYALLFISERFLGIKPFWFWLDQEPARLDNAEIPYGQYRSPAPAVKFRGWFFNDEVLLLKWHAGKDREFIWRMAFESLLRCGGNIVIPGTDKNSRLNRQLASDMGLWITHHHAEPLGAELFARAYPGVSANYFENSELFYRLWEDAVKEQAKYKVVWNLCFRGQGDCPFWSSDSSGRFNTPEKRGALIADVIKKQCDIVRRYVENPVFCTNLYGEIMELYNEGHITLADDIIKVRADNGYGKMVTRRRDNHSVRVSSMPVKNDGSQGIYYHVSFYDLQAANHITMLPNSVDFVNSELSEVLRCGGNDFWIINCSNVRPHAYYLDAVRKIWYGDKISDVTHSVGFAADYYDCSAHAAKCLTEFSKAVPSYGINADEHAGEQFYTENSRIMAHQLILDINKPAEQLNWLTHGESLSEQAKNIKRICFNAEARLDKYLKLCESENCERLFSSTILLQARIHNYCLHGLINCCNSVILCAGGKYKEAFLSAGDAAVWFENANHVLRDSEYGIWEGFYQNDCFADIKHSAFMMRKAMGYIRELGDNCRHDKWYRETVYAPEDRDVFLLLVTDNHMTDDELYGAMKTQK